MSEREKLLKSQLARCYVELLNLEPSLLPDGLCIEFEENTPSSYEDGYNRAYEWINKVYGESDE
ncbi:MAG: hypothetical protein AAF126_15925 [Chloroflexota bacterium]